MTAGLDDLSAAAIARAIEENSGEFLLTLGRAGGGVERVDPTIHWTIGGSPIDYHNAVVRADLTQATADAAIIASRECMCACGVSGSWHVGPSMRPADLGGRLIANGFVHTADEPGMAVDLRALRNDLRRPADLDITLLRGAADLAVWVDTLARGFGAGPHEARWTGAMYMRIGFGGATPWRHYLARLNGVPVATATLFFGAGVAGIYFVFTVEGARRQGIGAAITLAALHDARVMGYRVGVLGSSSVGESVYRRLGFTEYCKIGIYEWQLPPYTARRPAGSL